jgi:hypothetical protein
MGEGCYIQFITKNSNNMSKQTAVDWLYKTHFFKNGELTQEDFEQAKAMEREQIKDAYDKNKMGKVDYGEQYYNETFGK